MRSYLQRFGIPLYASASIVGLALFTAGPQTRQFEKYIEIPMAIALVLTLFFLGFFKPDWNSWGRKAWELFATAIVPSTVVLVTNDIRQLDFLRALEAYVFVFFILLLPLLAGIVAHNWKALFKSRPGPWAVSAWLFVLVWGFSAFMPKEAPKTRTPAPPIPVEIKSEVKTKFNDARNEYIAGKYDDCLKSLNQMSSHLTYENSADLKNFCEQGRNLVRRQKALNEKYKRLPASRKSKQRDS